MKALLVVLVILAIGLVGRMDYEDEKAQASYQCEMIKAGHWPAEVNPNCKDQTEVANAHE